VRRKCSLLCKFHKNDNTAYNFNNLKQKVFVIMDVYSVSQSIVHTHFIDYNLAL